MGNQQIVVAAPSVSFGEMERLAEATAQCGMFGIKTKQQALVLMAISQAEGRHPALAARDYNIINGIPSKKPEAMMRDMIRNNGKIEWHTLTDTQCEATFSHPSGGTVKISWDLDRAKQAGLAGKDNWRKYPRAMLRSRTVGEGVRTVCPMASECMYTPEEVADFDNGHKAPVVGTLPLQETTQVETVAQTTQSTQTETFDPETGEILEDKTETVAPHNIGVVENKNGKANWVQFGSEFIAALQTAQSRDEVEAWIKENKKLLNACKKEAEKVFGRISSFVEVTRQKFPQQVEVTI